MLGLIEEARTAGARLASTCRALALDVRTVQRWLKLGPEGGEDRRRGPTTKPANKLTDEERAQVIELLTSPEYRDLPPAQIVPRLADMGIYVASERTLYRVLEEERMKKHRGRKRPRARRRPAEHVATGPNQVWSWDITYLRSPVRGQFYYLYLFMDVWSRAIVGAYVHDVEDNEFAASCIGRLCAEQNVSPGDLVLHSDNGGPMTGATMKAKLEDLGVFQSLIRPRTSNDNAFSESLFATAKTRPGYPSEPFTTIEEARAWVASFVRWYNEEHRHSGISFVTPAQRHAGLHEELLTHRIAVYEKAKARTPNRWTGRTRKWDPKPTVRLNPPKSNPPMASEAA